MMTQIAIGLGAGAASALLYFAVMSGTALALMLFYVAPLPIIVAGLGWGWTTGLVAAVTGAALAGIATAPFFGLAFFIACSGPAAWLARLALLGRAVDPGNPSSPVEWYPASRLILWTSGWGIGAVLLAAMMMGAASDELRQSVAAVLERMIEGGAGAAIGLSDDIDVAALSRVLAMVLPALTVAVWTLTMLLNLWLGAQISIASGLLRRPMPRLDQIDYPSWVALAFAASLLLSFMPGMAGIAGTIAATALLVAYFILGLVVIHAITRDMAGRILLLAAVYFIMMVVFWAIPLIAALGLAEPFLRLRARVAGPTT